MSHRVSGIGIGMSAVPSFKVYYKLSFILWKFVYFFYAFCQYLQDEEACDVKYINENCFSRGSRHTWNFISSPKKLADLKLEKLYSHPLRFSIIIFILILF